MDSFLCFCFGAQDASHDYMMVNIAIKQLGMHCSGLQRDSLGDPLFATRGQWRRRAGDSDEMPPIDICSIAFAGLQYFPRFLVCQSHKPKESNVQLCSIIEQNFSEHSFAV